VSRQRIARSWLAILAPIYLLGLGLLADQTLHHERPPDAQPRAPVPPARTAPRSQAVIEPTQPVAPAQPPSTVDELLHKIRRSCPNAERADGCSPLTLTASLANDMPAVRAHYRELEQRYRIRLVSGDYVAIHALGFLRSRRALPALRKWLLREGFANGWRTAFPAEPQIFYADKHFPRHRALMQAIESIEGLPIGPAFKLTRDERRQLSRDAAGCFGDTAAQWLLSKLAGIPLPSSSDIRAHDAACRAAAVRM